MDGPSGIQTDVLDADDLLTLIKRYHVPDRHVVGRQGQLVSSRPRIVGPQRIRECRDWLVKQVEYRALNRPAQRLRQGLDLLPGRSREADEAIPPRFPPP